MGYNIALSDVIRKSTFTLPKYKDGFIDPDGRFISLKSHHHVEVALNIISQMSSRFIGVVEDSLKRKAEDLDILEKMLTEVNSDKPNNSRLARLAKKFCWFLSQGKLNWRIGYNELKKNLLELHAEYSKDYEKTKDELEKRKENSEINKFKSANRNRGWDAAEYLIVVHGYIAVENSYLLYRYASNYQLQEYNLHCFKDDEGKMIIAQMTEKEINQSLNKRRDKLAKEAHYFQRTENRFHCPSGFIRQEYLRWENECRKVGLNPMDLI